MSADEVRHALERFGRIEKHGSRSVEGVGLGLPLTRALVELHGGIIVLESAPDQGTVATVVLPRSGFC